MFTVLSVSLFVCLPVTVALAVENPGFGDQTLVITSLRSAFWGITPAILLHQFFASLAMRVYLSAESGRVVQMTAVQLNGQQRTTANSTQSHFHSSVCTRIGKTPPFSGAPRFGPNAQNQPLNKTS
jgi:hypothetical protein